MFLRGINLKLRQFLCTENKKRRSLNVDIWQGGKVKGFLRRSGGHGRWCFLTNDLFNTFFPCTLKYLTNVYFLQGKGMSSSAIPYSRNAPAWFKLSPDTVVEQIIKYARKGLTPSQIGVLLRDAHGVTQARVITGNKVLRILKSNGLAPEIPEDLYYLIKKAVSVRKHLERNRKDKDAKFRLILIESRIHRLARYYRTVSVLPPNWKYESATASALVN